MIENEIRVESRRERSEQRRPVAGLGEGVGLSTQTTSLSEHPPLVGGTGFAIADSTATAERPRYSGDGGGGGACVCMGGGT